MKPHPCEESEISETLEGMRGDASWFTHVYSLPGGVLEVSNQILQIINKMKSCDLLDSSMALPRI